MTRGVAVRVSRPTGGPTRPMTDGGPRRGVGDPPPTTPHEKRTPLYGGRPVMAYAAPNFSAKVARLSRAVAVLG